MTVVSVIGAGLIGDKVIDHLLAGRVPGTRLGSVLVRDRTRARPQGGVSYTDDFAEFLASKPDLILELAGPGALKQYGVTAIRTAETWSISAAAFADRDFEATVNHALEGGGRLRLLPGAITGLDAVAAAATDPASSISVTVGIIGQQPDAEPDFVGSARELALNFHGVNVVAAIAMAGHGLDATPVRFFHRRGSSGRNHVVEISSAHGSYQIHCQPTIPPGTSAVSACVLAALIARTKSLSVG